MNVLKNFINLNQLLNCYFFLQVKDHVYAYVINNEEFSMIAETRFLPELIVYAVKNKNIAGLIKFAMEKNR